MSDLFAIKCQLDRIEKKLDMKMKPKWIDIKSASEYCGLSSTTLRRGLREGKLKFRRSKRKLLFKYSWIDHFLNG